MHTERRTQLQDVTAAISKLVHDAAVLSGICYLYVPHTTAGIMINENADPDVAADIEAALAASFPKTPTTATPKATPTPTSRPRS